jgi:hypothetical protein
MAIDSLPVSQPSSSAAFDLIVFVLAFSTFSKIYLSVIVIS